MASDTFKRFRRSTKISYDQWHDGAPYNLDALDSLTGKERLRAEKLVIARKASDWRDVQALDRLGSERSIAHIKRALHSRDLEARAEAVWTLWRRKLISEPEIEAIIVKSLAEDTLLGGFMSILKLATGFPTPAVRSKVLECARDAPDHTFRWVCAERANFLYGGSPTLTNAAFAPLYDRFGSEVPCVREAAYLELCASIGVDPDSSDRQDA